MRRLSLVTIILVPVVLAMVVNLASNTVKISAAWWPWVVWSLSALLVVATVAIEVRRKQADERRSHEARARLDHAAARADGVLASTAPATPGAANALPVDVASFIGRRAELEQITRAPEGLVARGVVRIDAIDGMAGVGKTAFAVHVAHELAQHFPDGQLFIRLHGHTPGQQPVEPADALATLLLSAGIAADQIPPGLEARAHLWRARMAGKKTLMVLDDATGSDQVLPLLPGTTETLVLITSRRRLTALPQAMPVTLETLEAHEAAELFTLLADRPGLDAADAGVIEVARLCGYLPLAITLMAGQLKHHPAWTASSLATDLASAQDRLAAMRAENSSVAVAFDLSYRDLSADHQKLLRRLGLYPGTDIDAYAAAALQDCSMDAARTLLDDLYSHHLIEEPVHGRYRFHDLIRQHARSLSTRGNAAESDAAVDRLLDYYVHTAQTAAHHLSRYHQAEGAHAEIVVPESRACELPTPPEAASWMQAERPNLLAVANYATQNDRPDYVVAISIAMHGFLRTQGYWGDAFSLHHLSLTAARRAGDRYGEACTLNNLGFMQRLTGDLPSAVASQEQALHLYRVLGDQLGQANALDDLGAVQYMTGDYQSAAPNISQALALYRDLGDRLSQANAVRHMGVVQSLTGDYPGAATSISQALTLYRDLGDRLGQAGALKDLSFVQRLTGDYAAAAASLSQALGLYRELGDRNGEANALTYLGIVQQADGDYTAATLSQQEALGLYRSLGNRLGEATALNSIGELLLSVSDRAQAKGMHEQALQLAHEIGARHEEARALEDIGLCQLHEG